MAPKTYHIDSPAEKEMLLPEYNLKRKSGLAVGENDPTMSLETRALG
jgi:hypothetical protein